MSIGIETGRKLALLRLLLRQAVESSQLPAPYSADSVNRLHDVAEMFLALAVQHHHKKIPHNFIDYWEVLDKPLGRPLTYRAQMERFNKVRVGLKHFAIEPSLTEIESGRTAVTGLVEDECEPLFGVSLGDVSLTQFVSCEKSRLLLESAERHWAADDATAAFADLSDSFDELIDDYRRRKVAGNDQSVFDSVREMRMLSPFFRRVEDRDQAKFEDRVIDSLERLDRTVTLVGLGVDLRRLGRFKVLLPHVWRNVGGERNVHESAVLPKRTDDDFEFCRDFIIRTAVHLAEFDYEFDLPAEIRRHQQERRDSQQMSSG